MLHHLSPDRRDELQTASPERMIVLFYDQVIDCLHTAICAIARNDIQGRCDATTATIELLSGMLQSFGEASDDDVVNNLHKIHTFIIKRMPRVNIMNDARFLADAIRLVKPIRDSWAAVEKYASTGQEDQIAAPIAEKIVARPRLTVVAPTA